MTRSRFTASNTLSRRNVWRAALLTLGLATPLLAIPAWTQPTATPAPAAPKTPAEQWAKELSAFETSDQKQMPPQNAVLFIGSSTIRMWKSLDTDFPGVPTINRGFGGSVVSDSVALAPRLVWPYSPRAIVFYAGDNDLAANKTPDVVFADFKSFVAVVREKFPAIPIAFVSIKPSPSREKLMPLMQQTNSLIAKWIGDGHDPNLKYIDVWTAMTTPQNRPRPELFGPDKLHMNRQGYELWTKIVAPFVNTTK